MFVLRNVSGDSTAEKSVPHVHMLELKILGNESIEEMAEGTDVEDSSTRDDVVNDRLCVGDEEGVSTGGNGFVSGIDTGTLLSTVTLGNLVDGTKL
jgi:hypothetical protein